MSAMVDTTSSDMLVSKVSHRIPILTRTTIGGYVWTVSGYCLDTVWTAVWTIVWRVVWTVVWSLVWTVVWTVSGVDNVWIVSGQ